MKGIKKQLTKIPGIGDSKAGLMVRSGIHDWDILTAMSEEELTALKGIGPYLAQKIHHHLHPAPAQPEVVVEEVEAPPAPVEPAVQAPAPAPAEPTRAERAAVWFGRALDPVTSAAADTGAWLVLHFEAFVVRIGDRCLGVEPARP
jgi:hypothetical protein